MPAGDHVDVAGIATTILDVVVKHFDAAGVDLPGRTIIAPGNPRLIAWDCEQLVVTLSGIGWGNAPGTGSASATQTGARITTHLRHAIFAVQLLRCSPEPTSAQTGPPPAVEVTTAGLALLRDAALLSQALVELPGRIADGHPLGKHGSAIAGTIETLGPEGGICGVEGSIAVTTANLA